jgi:hypothetical protein
VVRAIGNRIVTVIPSPDENRFHLMDNAFVE